MGDLSSGERLFIERYATHWQLDRAVVEAGLSKGSVADDTALAHNLLARREVRYVLHETLEERANTSRLQEQDLINQLVSIVEVDPAQAFDSAGCLLPLAEMPLPLRRSIAQIETRELLDSKGEHVGFAHKIKWADKLKAFEMLGRHLKLFTDKIDVSGEVDIAEQINAARRRARGEKKAGDLL